MDRSTLGNLLDSGLYIRFKNPEGVVKLLYVNYMLLLSENKSTAVRYCIEDVFYNKKGEMERNYYKNIDHLCLFNPYLLNDDFQYEQTFLPYRVGDSALE